MAARPMPRGLGRCRATDHSPGGAAHAPWAGPLLRYKLSTGAGSLKRSASGRAPKPASPAPRLSANQASVGSSRSSGPGDGCTQRGGGGGAGTGLSRRHRNPAKGSAQPGVTPPGCDRLVDTRDGRREQGSAAPGCIHAGQHAAVAMRAARPFAGSGCSEPRSKVTELYSLARLR